MPFLEHLVQTHCPNQCFNDWSFALSDTLSWNILTFSDTVAFLTPYCFAWQTFDSSDTPLPCLPAWYLFIPPKLVAFKQKTMKTTGCTVQLLPPFHERVYPFSAPVSRQVLLVSLRIIACSPKPSWPTCHGYTQELC